MKNLLARIAGAVSAFEIGREVGQRVDRLGVREGLRWNEELKGDLGRHLGKEDRWAFAAGVATLGWALLTKKEMLLVFLGGLLVGYHAFQKLWDLVRGPALAAPPKGATFDTTGALA